MVTQGGRGLAPLLGEERAKKEGVVRASKKVRIAQGEGEDKGSLRKGSMSH